MNQFTETGATKLQKLLECDSLIYRNPQIPGTHGSPFGMQAIAKNFNFRFAIRADID